MSDRPPPTRPAPTAATERARPDEPVPQGVITVDARGVITSFDATAEAIFGRRRDDVIGRSLTFLFPGGAPSPTSGPALVQPGVDPEGLVRAFRRLEGRRGDGSTIPLDVLLARRAHDEESTLVAAVPAGDPAGASEQRDHTRKMQALSRVLRPFAHDLNNLLMVIQGNCDLARMRLEADPKRAAHLLGEVGKASERAVELIARVQDAVRWVAGRSASLELEPALQTWQQTFTLPEAMSVDMHVAEDLGHVNLTEADFRRLLDALVENAAEALGEGGQVRVRVARRALDPSEASEDLPAGDYVVLEVSDTGLGMGADARARLYEPFFTTKGGVSRGFGLSSAYGIVRRAGGRIDVTSEARQGTRVRVVLPRTSPFPTAPALEYEAGEAHGSLRGSGTILLVDDERVVLHLVQETLVRAGYDVLTAGGGQAALALAQEHGGRIDLVLTDVIMPGMNGRQLATRLQERHPDTPVLFMSAFPEEVLGTIDGGGVFPFLAKPFRPGDLLRQIRDTLASAES